MTTNNIDREGLGERVMAYLGKFTVRKRRPEDKSDNATLGKSSQLFDWKSKGSDADIIPAPKLSSTETPPLRVSNLISKQAAGLADVSRTLSKNVKDTFGDGWGVDYFIDKEGFRVPAPGRGVYEKTKWNQTFGSPIISSLAFGAIPAALYFGASKFLTPDKEGNENQTIEALVNEMIDEDAKSGKSLKSKEEYVQDAIARQRSNRWRNTLGIGLGTAALLHLQHINPKDWSLLYRYPKTVLQKKSSMLGPSGVMDYNTLHDSILYNPNLNPSIKQSALNALDFNPAPVMTSTNIINNAIYSGESAKTGLPIGRIITASAANTAMGYGLGKLFNVGSPTRLAALTGISGGIIAALAGGME